MLKILGSYTNQLNEGLICQVFECNDKGDFVGDTIVTAPITEPVNIDLTLNWVSPFENVGAEAKAPALTAMLQSGQAQAVITAVQSLIPESIKSALPKEFRDIVSGVSGAADNLLKTLQGRTSMTKVNSRQIFSNMPPVKFPISLYFRAWKDAKEEVEDPILQLMYWALSKKIADKSVLLNILETKEITIAGLFPSEVPVFVGIRYGGVTYAPLVIESISDPIVGPRDKDLNRLNCTIQLNLATLTAIDRADWAKYKTDYARAQILAKAKE